MAKLADAQDLGSCPERGVGSSPSARTIDRQVTTMRSPTLRAPLVDDLATVTDLVNRANASIGIPVVMDPAELGEEWQSSLTSMERDCRVITVDGRIVGVVWTLFFPSDTVTQRCYVEGAVDPDMLRRGYGRQLMDWGVRHAHELFATLTHRNQPWSIRVQHRIDDMARKHLMDRYGFAPVRWFDDLERSLDDLPPRANVEGIDVVGWPIDDPARDEIVRQVKNSSFADHWGSSPTPPDGWTELTRGFGSRLDLSRLAVDAASGEVVAFLLAKRYPSDDTPERRSASIDKLGTLPAFRGRGIASALLTNALHAFVDEGLTHALLDVDSANPTGAHRLYRSLGFEVAFSTVTSEIVVS